MGNYLSGLDDPENVPEDVDWASLDEMYDGDSGPSGYYDDEGNFIPVYAPVHREALDRPPLAEVFANCLLPNVESASHSLSALLILCLACSVVIRLGRLPPLLLHSVYACGGLAACQFFFGATGVALLVGYSMAAFVVLQRSQLRGSLGAFLSAITVAYIVGCELLMHPQSWHAMRGAQMVLSMKVISLAFDMDRDVVHAVDYLQYASYAFNPGTVIFGPWTSVTSYLHSSECVNKKLIDLRWLWHCATRLLLASFCLVTSTCFVQWLIPEDRSQWLVSYRDALSFRSSHYFVSYVGELTALLVGLGVYSSAANEASHVKLAERVVITRPSRIEVPRSLVEVVTNWNLPMHRWLKTYVFATARPLGTLAAVLLTYVASALLHGLNFQLAAVLLSLGLYSYVEHVLRHKLATGFSACIEARKCSTTPAHGCTVHAHSTRHPAVLLTNCGFILLAVFHLAYLGVMFDTNDEQDKGYTMKHALSKWATLGFSSHYVACATYVFYWLIK